jgi:hypothetical protein
MSSSQLEATHLDLTQWFINENPDDIVIQRRTRVPDGEGGFTFSAPTLLPSQVMRKVQRGNISDVVQMVNSAGQVVIPSYILIAMPDADIQVFDLFTLDGRLHEVMAITNRPRWRIQAEIYAHA